MIFIQESKIKEFTVVKWHQFLPINYLFFFYNSAGSLHTKVVIHGILGAGNLWSIRSRGLWHAIIEITDEWKFYSSLELQNLQLSLYGQ